MAKLLLAAAGILVFGYGVHEDDSLVRWIGIGLIAAAAILRFARSRRG
jgi:hypothetical protein